MRHLLPALVLLLAVSAPAAHAAAPGDDSKPDIEVYIIEPKDGATVTNPVRVVFGLRGMGVAPAGVNALNTGHHHLLIDTEVPRLDQPIPAGNKNIRHFNGGQTETQLILLPGTHTLQLLVGDYGHMSYMPPLVSPKVTITVKP
jgi:hypothetical protein